MEKFRKKFFFDFFSNFFFLGGLSFLEPKKKFFLEGKKLVFLKKKLKKKIWKNFGKIFFSIFFSLYTSKNTGFWSSSRANNFFSKNGLHHFLGEPSGYLHAKFQKNLPSGYREKLVTNGLTNGLTDGHSLMHRTIFPHIFGRSKNFFFKKVTSRLNKYKAFLNALARNKQNVKNWAWKWAPKS